MAFRKGQTFHGIHRRTPGVYSYVESKMREDKTNGAKNIAFIGESKGGVPGEITFIEDPETAKELLKGGPLLDACLKAYNPVVSTKDTLQLGGADSIFAIRANNATKAKTAVYQAKEVDSTIQRVTETKHANSTGSVTTTGKFTGSVNKTFKITITSEGTKDIGECEYMYCLASDDVPIAEQLSLSETSNATDKELADGVKVTFNSGTYTHGDTFLIPCTAKVTESEFVYTLESKDYGDQCNHIAHKLEDGTVAGTKKLTVYDGISDEYEVFDNLGGAFTITYKGKEKYAAISIVPNGEGDAIKLQTFVGESAEKAIIDLDIDLTVGQFKSIRNLAMFLAGYENYEVETVPTINAELNVHDLDFLEKEDIKETKSITAVLRDLKKTCAFQSEFVVAAIINREVSNYNDYPFTNLTGGTEGRLARSFIPLLDLIGKYDIDYVVPLTDDMSLIAETKEHVIQMSERHNKERRLICGTSNGITAGVMLQNAKKLAHERVQYVGPGFYDDGKLYPPYITAAMIAGRVAFLGVESATADCFNFDKPEMTFKERDRNKLIDAGVMFFDQVVSDYNHKLFYSRLVWDYTTFSEYNDTLKVERSTGAIADQLSKELRKALDKMLTGKLTPVAVLESAKNRTISILKDYIKRGIIVEYQTPVIKKHRDRVDVSVAIAPVTPTNFAMIDMTFYDKDIEI